MQYILEIAKNLEKDLEFEIKSLLENNITLEKLSEKYYLLSHSFDININYLKYSIVIKSVYKVLCKGKDIYLILERIKPKNNFYLDVKHCKLNKKELAEFWEKKHQVKGNIDQPEHVYVIFKINEIYYLTEKFFETQRKICLKRGPKYRPFKRSGVLNSELARLMVNCGKVRAGTKVLDPFCGSGSILIEAYYNNAEEIVGIDIDKRMILGCIENLKYLNVDLNKVKLINEDCRKAIEKFPDNYFNAVITDPPYGISTKASDEISKLLRETFEKCYYKLKKGGRLVFLVPKGFEYNDIISQYKIIYTSEFYVHKRLTRLMVVAEK